LSDTKLIAGYPCNKAHFDFGESINKDKHLTADVYYTAQLPYFSEGDMFHGLKGLPVEYQCSANDIVTKKLIVSFVAKESVPDSHFNIPVGYKDMTSIK